MRAFLAWSRRDSWAALLLALVVGILVYFFGVLRLYTIHTQAIWSWAWMRFLPQYNQEHSKLIPLIIILLLWYHRDRIRKAAKVGSNWGLLPLAFGIGAYIIGARALQPRVAIFSFPFLALGVVWFLWGKQVARILLFPISLIFFMIPLGAIEQMTFQLQFLIVHIVSVLSRLSGIAVYSIGTSIRPMTGDWGFEIVEGCSGIRSLIAIIMVTALYVHISQPTLWKKAIILCFSILFAIIGNAGRIFTIIVLAHFGFPKFAGGMYHDWSSQLIFFPVALLSMFGFAKLLDLHLGKSPVRGQPEGQG